MLGAFRKEQKSRTIRMMVDDLKRKNEPLTPAKDGQKSLREAETLLHNKVAYDKRVRAVSDRFSSPDIKKAFRALGALWVSEEYSFSDAKEAYGYTVRKHKHVLGELKSEDSTFSDLKLGLSEGDIDLVNVEDRIEARIVEAILTGLERRFVKKQVTYETRGRRSTYREHEETTIIEVFTIRISWSDKGVLFQILHTGADGHVDREFASTDFESFQLRIAHAIFRKDLNALLNSPEEFGKRSNQ